jgi:glucose-1-phosphate thymidylyltransferase
MKGVILAGGTGSRLGKLTSVLNKHLVAVGNVPMIEYPLKTLKDMGISDIVVVTGSEHAGNVITYLTNEHPEIDFTYKIQKKAGGIAQALSLVENICKGENIAVILGDNIYDENFSDKAKEFEESNSGATFFLKKVSDPKRFGVAVISDNGKIKLIEEKPEFPKSNLAVTGLYLYDSTVFEKIKKIKPSTRGEYEISDVNQLYISDNKASCVILNGFWSDAGTPKSRKIASDYALEREIFASE